MQRTSTGNCARCCAANRFEMRTGNWFYDFVSHRRWFDTSRNLCKIKDCSSYRHPARDARYEVTRRSGGIGRRAWFRSMYPQGCGGSSPFFGTMRLQHSAAPGDFPVMPALLYRASATQCCLFRWLSILFLFLFSTSAFAQGAIPVGTVLPAQLNSSLNSRKSQPGRLVSARIMQDVPLPAEKKIPAGARLSGRVIAVQPADGGQSAHVIVRFDTLRFSRHSIPITTSLRALASLMEVEVRRFSRPGPDRGTPWPWITRNLIGGEVAYGDGGPVTRGSQVVGRVLIDGIIWLRPRNCSTASPISPSS